jgi:hypothetical protein
LAIVDLPHGFAGRRGDDRATGDAEPFVVGTQAGEREGLVLRHEDVPGILAAIDPRLGQFVEAVGRDQAPRRLEGILEGAGRVGSLGAGVEHRGLRHFLRPPRNQPPAALTKLVVAVLACGDERYLVGRRDVVGWRVVAPQFGRSRQPVEPVNFGPGQISGEASAHGGGRYQWIFRRPALTEQGIFS